MVVFAIVGVRVWGGGGGWRYDYGRIMMDFVLPDLVVPVLL